MFPSDQPWKPLLRWDTPAGALLDKLIAALPSTRSWEIIVFGSSPLQLALDPQFLSGDVDVIGDNIDELNECCRAAGLLKGQRDHYIEPCPAYVFKAPLDWRFRAHVELRKHVRFIIPHPLDILTSKVVRVEEKDLNAFRLVRRLTGHPTPEEMIRALRGVVDIYRPSFDEEAGRNALANTKLLWREIFGADIDVRKEIIEPAIAERRAFYEANAADHRKEQLRRIAESGGDPSIKPPN